MSSQATKRCSARDLCWILLSERSRAEEAAYCRVLLRGPSGKRQNYKDSKLIRDPLGVQGRGRKKWVKPGGLLGCERILYNIVTVHTWHYTLVKTAELTAWTANLDLRKFKKIYSFIHFERETAWADGGAEREGESPPADSSLSAKPPLGPEPETPQRPGPAPKPRVGCPRYADFKRHLGWEVRGKSGDSDKTPTTLQMCKTPRCVVWKDRQVLTPVTLGVSL